MLFEKKTGEQISSMPHQREFDRWRQSIPEAGFGKIMEHINAAADAVQSIGIRDLIAEDKWTGTPFELVYMKACFMDSKLSRTFLELILWFVIQNRTDEWYYQNTAAGNSAPSEKYYYRRMK